MKSTPKPFWQKRRERKREAPKRIIVYVSRWTVAAYGRQVAVCTKEADAYRIADDYRWLGVSAYVTPTSLKVSA